MISRSRFLKMAVFFFLSAILWGSFIFITPTSSQSLLGADSPSQDRSITLPSASTELSSEATCENSKSIAPPEQWIARTFTPKVISATTKSLIELNKTSARLNAGLMRLEVDPAANYQNVEINYGDVKDIPWYRSDAYQGLATPFKLEAKKSGDQFPEFGLVEQVVELSNDAGEKIQFNAYASTIILELDYDETELLSKGLEESTLALFVYNETAHAWRKMLSVSDTDQNRLRVMFTTKEGNIFQLGARAAAQNKLVIIDPDSDVGHVDQAGYQAREGTYNLETALNISATLTSCAGVEVDLTHEMASSPVNDQGMRADFILNYVPKPDAALVVAYDSHSAAMAYGPGGSKGYARYDNGRQLADAVISSLYNVYPYYHAGRLYSYPYSPTSIEVTVAEQDPSIPIGRVEIGLLSLYQNRSWIDNDFQRPSTDRLIPNAIALGLRDFLGLSCPSPCASYRAPINNQNYSETAASAEVREEIIDEIQLDAGAPIQNTMIDAEASLLDGRLVLSTTPPFVMESSPELESLQALLSVDQGSSVLPSDYLVSDGSITITLPIASMYEQLRDQFAGNVTMTLPLSMTYPVPPTDFVEVLSQTVDIGTCMGLMTWLGRYCAGYVALSDYGVSDITELNPYNRPFLKEVLWFQLMQLTVEVSNSLRIYDTAADINSELANEILNPVNEPFILLLAPEQHSCQTGYNPTGHALLAVGYDANTSTIQAIDPNTPDLVSITIAGDQWTYPNAPYPPIENSSNYTWTGRELAIVSVLDIPPLTNLDYVSWVGLETDGEIVYFNTWYPTSNLGKAKIC